MKVQLVLTLSKSLLVTNISKFITLVTRKMGQTSVSYNRDTRNSRNLV